MNETSETQATLDLILKKLGRIEEAQRRTAEDVDRIGQTMTQIEGMVRTVIAEVKPTIDSLMANPMLRMALGIKG